MLFLKAVQLLQEAGISIEPSDVFTSRGRCYKVTEKASPPIWLLASAVSAYALMVEKELKRETVVGHPA
jgi:hypothetical protein